MQLEEAAPRPSFGRHETFHLRYVWLPKAYNLLKDDPKLFTKERALVDLGVGKNMVHAIRFWGLACKLFRENKKAHTVHPTELADMLLDERSGLDPYMDRPASMWILHWLLYAPPSLVPSWWIIMNEITASSAETDKVTDHVLSRVAGVERYRSPSTKSVKKDIDVFVHTYTSKRGKEMVEDYLDCPLRSLKILKQKDRDEMRFVYGKKPGMSPLAVAFACLDFADRAGVAGRTVSVNRLTMERGGPGNVLKLSEADMAEMLAAAAEQCPAISVKTTIGTTSLSFRGTAAEARGAVLGAMYGRPARRPRIPAGRKLEALAA